MTERTFRTANLVITNTFPLNLYNQVAAAPSTGYRSPDHGKLLQPGARQRTKWERVWNGLIT